MTATEQELRTVIANLWQATSGFIKGVSLGPDAPPGAYDAVAKACTIAKEEGKFRSLPVARPLETLPNG